MNLYFDKDGTPIDVITWGVLFENQDYKVVDQTELDNGVFVSTVWLGLNHGFGKKKEIFETMVFPEKGNYSEVDCKRYATLSEAKKGHGTMVRKWRRRVTSETERRIRTAQGKE